MQAYVLIQTDSRKAGIAKHLRAVPGVVLADDLQGPYDAIALARAGSSARSLEGVIATIRELPGVTRAISAPLPNSAADIEDDEAA